MIRTKIMKEVCRRRVLLPAAWDSCCRGFSLHIRCHGDSPLSPTITLKRCPGNNERGGEGCSGGVIWWEEDCGVGEDGGCFEGGRGRVECDGMSGLLNDYKAFIHSKTNKNESSSQ